MTDPYSGRKPGGFVGRRVCPGCGAWHEGPLETRSAVPAESAPFEVISESWRGFFNRPLFFSYARCTSCGLLYCPMYLTVDGLAHLYGDMPDNTAGIELPALVATQRGYVKAALGNGRAKGGYLELGPDVGLFTGALAQQADLSHLWLVEPNRAVHGQLRDAVQSHPATIVKTLEELGDDALDLSLAAMIHVLDHLLDPLQTLREVRSRLTPGAQLIVVTHDESSVLSRVARRRWPAYCPQHPQLFRPATISAMLRKSGFEVLRITKSSNTFPITYLIKHAAHLIGASVPFSGLRGPSLPLRLGNILTMASAI